MARERRLPMAALSSRTHSTLTLPPAVSKAADAAA